MNIFSTVEKQTQRVLDERLSLLVRLPVLLYLLLGRRPARHLAQSLIVILLLISPLSFSTDKVSNFTYECPVSCCGSEKPSSSLPSSGPHLAEQVSTLSSR